MAQHYFITEIGDEKKPINKQNSIQFTKSVDEGVIIAAIEIAGESITGVKVPLNELKDMVKTLSE